MRTLYLLSIIFIGLNVSACSVFHPTQSTDTSTHKIKTAAAQPTLLKAHKDPIAVAVYTKTIPLNRPYKVIGEETISKYNFVGIKRQQATIRDAMRTLAASMGGDAVIDVQHDDKRITARVIAFEQEHNKTTKRSQQIRIHS